MRESVRLEAEDVVGVGGWGGQGLGPADAGFVVLGGEDAVSGGECAPAASMGLGV